MPRRGGEPAAPQACSPYAAAGLSPVSVTLWMYILRFSSPESTNRAASPSAVVSNSRPPTTPYSTLLCVLLKVVQVTSMEPGSPVTRSSVTGSCRLWENHQTHEVLTWVGEVHLLRLRPHRRHAADQQRHQGQGHTRSVNGPHLNWIESGHTARESN